MCVGGYAYSKPHMCSSDYHLGELIITWLWLSQGLNCGDQVQRQVPLSAVSPHCESMFLNYAYRTKDILKPDSPDTVVILTQFPSCAFRPSLDSLDNLACREQAPWPCIFWRNPRFVKDQNKVAGENSSHLQILITCVHIITTCDNKRGI